MFRRNFLFGKDGGTANLIDVGSDDLYQPGKGYGFVTEKNRREQEGLQIREVSLRLWNPNEINLLWNKTAAAWISRAYAANMNLE